MRRLLLSICVVLPIAAGAVVLLADAGAARAQDRATIAAERDRLLARINAYRAEHGAAPLRLSATLQRAAEGHSADMASRDYFEHTTPEGRSPFDRASAAGYPSRMVGENLAAGHAGADATFTQWRNSPAHDAGMRDRRYRAVGLGYVGRPGSRYRHYWTMLMGDRVDVPLEAGAPAAPPAPPVLQPGVPTSPDDAMWPGDTTPGGYGQQDDCDDDAAPSPAAPAGWVMGPFGFPMPAIPGLTVPAAPGAAQAPRPGTAPAAPTAGRPTAPTIDVQQLWGLLQSLGVVGLPSP